MKSFRSIALLLTVISSLSNSGSVNAGVITLYATHQTIAAGGTGSFDILLRNDLTGIPTAIGLARRARRVRWMVAMTMLLSA